MVANAQSGCQLKVFIGSIQEIFGPYNCYDSYENQNCGQIVFFGWTSFVIAVNLK